MPRHRVWLFSASGLAFPGNEAGCASALCMAFLGIRVIFTPASGFLIYRGIEVGYTSAKFYTYHKLEAVVLNLLWSNFLYYLILSFTFDMILFYI
jgi:hypothetical protein